MRRVTSGLVLLLCWADLAMAGQRGLAGRRLEDALRVLQQAGLPIVFSSEVVKPDMRVLVEPRAKAPRQQLDELLAPHGLKAEQGPGHRILVVPDRFIAAREPPRQPTTASPNRAAPSSDSQAAAEYSDRITVWGIGERPIDGGGSEAALNSSAVRAATSVLTNDGLDAVRSMPRVVAADDYRAQFSVRSSDYRQIGIVIDGVATPWLQHMVYGRSDAGSLSMFASDAVDRVSVQAGAYPRRYEDVLGAQVDLTFKDGSRDSTRWVARAGGTSAELAGEGPIGSDRRGSWAAGVRESFRSWPPQRLSQNDVGFGFGDARAKLTYDVSASEQVSVTALAGRSTLETADEPLVGPLGNGIDRAAMISVGWRSIVNSRTLVRQRVFFVGQELESSLSTGQLAGRSSNRALGYRGEALHSIMGGLLTEGAEVSSVAGARDVAVSDAFGVAGAFRASWATRAAYVNFARHAVGGLWLEGGARVSDSTLVHQSALAPWIRATWRFTPTWTINASAGASRQFPELDAVLGPAGTSNLVPERARLVDVGVEQRLARVRWQATLFNRRENDVLRRPDVQAMLADGVVLTPSDVLDRYRNALSGTARGVELVLIPDDASARVSGWMSYTYATAQQTDASTNETFWSDFDRRHAVNAVGVFRAGRQTTLGVIVRSASGAPIPGYFALNDGKLGVGNHRNVVRLPAYVRVDARAQRSFFSSRHALTVFGEVLNVFNRANQGLAGGTIQPLTGEAIGITRPLLPRKISVGVEISLGR